jgi:hypothetical protein
LDLEGYIDPETAEVVACREGLALASDIGLQTLRVVSDCVNAVRSIHGEGFGRYGPIILEIKTQRESITRVEFVHEGRCSNIDAYCLARSSVNFWYKDMFDLLLLPMEFVLVILMNKEG